MNISLKALIGGMLIAAALSAAFTKYYFPRIDTKVETVEKEVIRTDVVTITKEIVKTDGTKEIVTTVVDKSVKKTDTKEVAIKYDVTSKYIFGVGAISNFKDKPEYEASAGMRILGPLFGQLKYQTNGYVGASILVEF